MFINNNTLFVITPWVDGWRLSTGLTGFTHMVNSAGGSAELEMKVEIKGIGNRFQLSRTEAVLRSRGDHNKR